MTVQDELLELERGFWGAGGTPDFYRVHFADDGRCVFGIGILDKDATLVGIEQGTPWTELDLSDLEVVEVGPDAAALVYRASALPEGGEEPYEVFVSSTYVRRDGRWRLLLHQHSPVLPEPVTD